MQTAHFAWLPRATERMVRYAESESETVMTKREANQRRSLDAVMARKAEFDAVLAELQQVSVEHFGADPDAVFWGEACWLADATAKLKDIADHHFRRGEYGP